MSRACQLTVFEGRLKERARPGTSKIRRLSSADAHPSYKGVYIHAALATHRPKSRGMSAAVSGTSLALRCV